MTVEALRRALDRRAAELGFALVGVAGPERSGHSAFYRSWLEQGLHGEMGYLARADAVERRADLGLTLEDVASVVVVAHEYYQEDPDGLPGDPSRGVIARYARGRDYHRVLGRRLDELLAWLDDTVEGGARGRVYVDTGPILERELAERAGLGWFGKNTMLIHPRRGSYFFLGVLLVDVELPRDEPFGEDRCGTCRACLEACPTGALLGRNEAGAPVMDATRCISYLTIESRGPIPVELRPAIGNRVYGCDICQEVCPFNTRFAEEAAEPGYAAREPGEPPRGADRLRSDVDHPGTASPSLIALLATALDDAAWESFSRGSAMRRAGRHGFARNVCVALGNWGSPEAVPALVRALEDEEALVRGHAVWALGRVGSPSALEALEAASVGESDAFVRSELEAVLAR